MTDLIIIYYSLTLLLSPLQFLSSTIAYETIYLYCVYDARSSIVQADGSLRPFARTGSKNLRQHVHTLLRALIVTSDHRASKWSAEAQVDQLSRSLSQRF